MRGRTLISDVVNFRRSQVRALRDAGTAMPQIARRVTINTGKNAGRYPFVGSLYRALAEVATIA